MRVDYPVYVDLKKWKSLVEANEISEMIEVWRDEGTSVAECELYSKCEFPPSSTEEASI